MSDMADLLARLRAATGADRELDAEIAALFGAVKWVQANYTMDMHPAVTYDARHPYKGMTEPVQSYTASLDAALTLVPADWHVTLSGLNDGWHVRLNTTWAPTPERPERAATAFTHTPALALCIAALEARRAGGGA